ncbi:hypothetical protein EYF80_033603 [Liparis tanakae]|uniref:Uncharacterized protein n=1 Tax=Liparis tanakae TaxID=230148 RepID=A0A4Z2GRM6_9TELE|nr:hypothetical protein EYF80_033603 [Liparis tanakae]
MDANSSLVRAGKRLLTAGSLAGRIDCVTAWARHTLPGREVLFPQVADEMETLHAVVSLPVLYFNSCSRIPFTLDTQQIVCIDLRSAKTMRRRCRRRSGSPPRPARDPQGRAPPLDLRALGLPLPAPGLVSQRLPVHPQPASREETQTDPEARRGLVFAQLSLDERHLGVRGHAGQVASEPHEFAAVAGQQPKTLRVIRTADGSEVGVNPPAVLLSLGPGLLLRDVDVLGKSCRRAEEEQDSAKVEGEQRRDEDAKRRRGRISWEPLCFASGARLTFKPKVDKRTHRSPLIGPRGYREFSSCLHSEGSTLWESGFGKRKNWRDNALI